jgi:hypothetical protein
MRPFTVGQVTRISQFPAVAGCLTRHCTCPTRRPRSRFTSPLAYGLGASPMNEARCRRVSEDRWKTSATSTPTAARLVKAPNLIALWKGTSFVIDRRFAICFDLRNLIAARLSCRGLAKALDHHQPFRQAFVEETKTKASAENAIRVLTSDLTNKSALVHGPQTKHRGHAGQPPMWGKNTLREVLPLTRG